MAAKTNEMLLTKEEVLMNEDDLLKGLLQAASFKNDVENYKLIQVKRNGKLLFQFRVRPLEESEIGECRKKATKYAPNPNNRNLPKVEVETDYIKLRPIKSIWRPLTRTSQKHGTTRPLWINWTSCRTSRLLIQSCWQARKTGSAISLTKSAAMAYPGRITQKTNFGRRQELSLT